MRVPQSLIEGLTACEVPVERQAQEAILEKIGAAPEDVFLDGELHRFAIEGDRGSEKSGWYVLYGNGLPAGAFGSWRSGDTFRWHALRTEPLTAAEHAALEETYRLAHEQRDEKIRERQERSAITCAEIWIRAPAAGDDHPYLQRKKVRSHGLRVTGDGRLIMPIYVENELSSLQYISPEGQKEFHGGGKVAGGYFRIPAGDRPASGARYVVEGYATGASVQTEAQGGIAPLKPPAACHSVFITEGYATGASVHEATDCEVWVALNAGNLLRVGRFLRRVMPEADLVFVADNDESGVGQRAASEAAEAVRGRVILPPEPGDANDYAVRGRDLRELLLERRRWIVPVMEFCSKPLPIRWLIRSWLQENSLMMVFGPPASGKTFLVLDMALTIACPQIESWQGLKVKHSPVVYLAGEGHAGLRARIAGWIAHRGVTGVEMYVGTGAVDLNAPGGVAQTLDEIRACGVEPGLIVVDTLNRFMIGDENKAVDVKTMLDACTALQREFRCSVLIVHHTGVAENAQGRARGSSAWKGAMDIELCVNKAEGEPLVTLHQTKNKDADSQEPLIFELVRADVPGWFDDDGVQISTRVIERSEEEGEAKEKLSRSLQFALNSFIEAASTAGLLTPEGHFAGLTREAWRRVFYEMSTLETFGAKKIAFYRAQKELLALGKIRLQENMTYRLDGLISGITEENIAARLREHHDH